MKRHESLRPLSRDHHHGLVEARAVRWALSKRAGTPDSARVSFLHMWDERLRAHFAAEEELLLPLIADPTDAARLRGDHEKIRALVERVRGDVSVLGALAHELELHIRWEERTLFPRIEGTADEARLAIVAAELVRRGRPTSGA